MPRKKKKAPPKKRQTPRRKKAVKRPLKRPVKKKPASRAAKKPKEVVIGKVTHYFPHVSAAVVKMKQGLNVGDTIKIKGHTTDLTQKVVSMQIDRVPIDSAKKGQEIGLMVESRVRQHDLVYKV